MNRLSLQEVLRLRAQRETQFEKDTRVTKAYTVGVDFTDSCRVDGREGYKWVREYGVNGGVFQVAGVNVQDRVNLPVLVGYEPKEPYKRMIISVDWSWVIDLPGWQDGGGSTPGEPFLPNHATSHEWPDYTPGPDAMNTYLRALTPLRVYPGTGLSISVAPYTYDVMDGDGVRQLLRYPGESDIDITAYQPASGFQVALLVYLDRGADAIAFVAGTAVVDVPTLTPPNPALPDNAILLSIIRLSGDAAAIFETNIADIRQLWDYHRPDYGQAIYDLYYIVASIEGGTIYGGGGSGGGYPFNVITVDAVNPEADYDNVAAAIAVAISGDVISIGPGVYTCDAQSLPAGVDLIGYGPGITILYTEGTTALTVNNGSFIQDIEIQAITTSIDSKPVIVDGSSVTMYNVYTVAHETTAGDDAWAVTINGNGTTLRNCYLQVLDGATLRGIVANGTDSNFTDVIGGRIDTGGNQDVYAPSGHRVVLQYVYISAPANGGVTGANVYGNTLSWMDGSHTWWAGDAVRVRLHDNLNLQLAQGVDIYAFSDDQYMSGVSSKVVPTERAVKLYVDSFVASGAYVLKAGDTMTGQLSIDGTANETQLLVQANSTQTAPIVNIERSDGTDLFRVGEGVLIGSGTVPAAGSLTVQTSLTLSGFTNDRIPFATTGGLIVSSDLLQWNDANGRLGVGMTPAHTVDILSTSSPAIRVQRSATTAIDIARLYNPNTTNANAAILSFSSNTSGTGATNDVTFADIRGSFNTHNNATSTGVLIFTTRQTNVLATRMTIGDGVMVGTVTDPGAGKLAVATQVVLPATGSTGGIVIGGTVNLYASLPNILRIDDTLEIGEAHTIRVDGSLDLNQQRNGVRLLFSGNTDSYLFNAMGATDRIGIGVAAPESKLHVVGGNVQFDGAQLNIWNNGAAVIDNTRYSSDASPSILLLNKARGTFASRSNVAAGDILGQFVASGYETTTPAFRAAGDMYIQIPSGSTVSSTSMPGQILFRTCSNGSITRTTRLTIREGLQVGASPTGGDKGAGTINVSGDIYKNNTAYTNPDYVLEKYYTGRIEQFAGNDGADAYDGILPLAKLAGYLRDNLHLPGRSKVPMGIFERSDMAQQWLEEVAIYITQLHERLEALEG